jgi:hypothetical protein
MPRSYGCAWNGTNTVSSTVPIMGITSAATVRPAIYDIINASDATPADAASTFLLRRFTGGALSGGTSGTPAPMDSLDTAAAASYMYGASIGAPTLTASTSVLQFSQNQRATFRWVAVPGKEIILPAVATAGVCMLPTVNNGGTANFVGVWEYTE